MESGKRVSFLFKRSLSFRVLLSNQERARAHEGTPKVVVWQLRNKNCGLSPVSETGIRHQLVLASPSIVFSHGIEVEVESW